MEKLDQSNILRFFHLIKLILQAVRFIYTIPNGTHHEEFFMAVPLNHSSAHHLLHLLKNSLHILFQAADFPFNCSRTSGIDPYQLTADWGSLKILDESNLANSNTCATLSEDARQRLDCVLRTKCFLWSCSPSFLPPTNPL